MGEDELAPLLAGLSPEDIALLVDDLPPEAAAALAAEIGASSASAAESPLGQALQIDPTYVARPHLQHISDRVAQAVQDVENGQNRLISIGMPPRSGKTTLTTLYAPAWILSRRPDWHIALTSHDGTLAASWGRQIRRWVESGALPGVKVANDAGAVKEWETTAGGGVLSRSVRESFTGRGARVLLIDDPVKDFADAHSAVMRDGIWDWWRSVAQTRLEPPYLVIVVQTRWHEDDMTGRLLSPEHEGDPDAWERLTYPAIAEPGDVLGREPGEPLLSPLLPDETAASAVDRWEAVRASVGSYVWSAMYQQAPAPSTGAIFHVDWWQYWTPDTLPDRFDKVLTSWDCAFKATSTSDYVVGQKWGVKGADHYLLDQVRGRWTFTETMAQMRTFCEGVTENLVEDKANGTAIIDTLRRDIPGMIPVNPTESKEARARAVTPQIEAGNVYLPRSAPWLADLLSETRSFPSGSHDDIVDCLTQALNRLRGAAGPARVSDYALRMSLPGL